MANADHAHYHLAGDALIGAARDVMVGAGEQWTDMRAAVFKTLSAEQQPASAYEIADKLSRHLDRRIVPNSVYRILDLFVANNVAKRVESSNGYVANAHPGCLHDCIYMVCDACGGVAHIDDDKLSGLLRKRVETTGFRVAQPVLEVRGTCAACGTTA